MPTSEMWHCGWSTCCLLAFDTMLATCITSCSHVVEWKKCYVFFFPAGGSLLLSHDVRSHDISIDMDEVQRERGQMQLLQEQVNYITFSNA